MKIAARIVSFLCLLGTAPFVFAEENLIWLTGENLYEAQLSGVELPKPGEYTVWVWSRNEAPLLVEVGGQSFEIAPSAEAEKKPLSWKKAGVIRSASAETVSLALLAPDTRLWVSSRQVGYLALTPNADWNPERFFEESRVYAESGEAVKDGRAMSPRSVDDYYTFPGFRGKSEWLEHKRDLEEHIYTSMGANPLPRRTPLNAKVFDRVEYDDYTVEKAYFESYPGFFVTGNLYRPKGKEGPFPAVLGPHGHWAEGRFANKPDGSVPGRAINFAKQGYIAFNYDMIGYVDSKQLTHKFGGPAEWLWGISLHGLQFWNSIRAVDFLFSLPDVDPDKIACSGASGGGTQTFLLAAADPRVFAVAPVNMISAHYQGGCLCENAPNLRVHNFNVEYAAAIAPRPLLMVSASGDWTDETPWLEFPTVRSIYRLFDAEENVRSVQIDAPHNYNKQSREAVYAWFGKWLAGNPNADQIKEQDFVVEEEKLRVFPGDLPPNAVTEAQLVAYLKKETESQLQEMRPDTSAKLRAFQRNLYPALKHTLGVETPDPGAFEVTRIAKAERPEYHVEKVVLGREGKGDRIPALLFTPHNNKDDSPSALLLAEKGKSEWFDRETGKPGELLQGLLQDGCRVLLPDLFLTGEQHSPFEPTARVTEISGGHFLTYNQTDTALRVQDIVTCAGYLKDRSFGGDIHIAARGQAGLWALLAAPFVSNLGSVIADTHGLPSDNDAVLLEQYFVPGLRRVGGFGTAQVLLAPMPLLLYNTQDRFDASWARQAYDVSQAPEQLKVLPGPVDEGSMLRYVRNIRGK